jgi:hypothetical protein
MSKKQKIIKVYLDTNLLIHGPEIEGCNKIKDLFYNGMIDLYISVDVKYEQENRSIDHYFNELRELQENNSFTYDMFSHGQLIDTIKQQNNLKNSEKSEILFWEGCNWKYIITKYDLFSLLSSIDQSYYNHPITKTCNLFLSVLIDKYKISKKDAMHVLHCTLEQIDILLTNDRNFINETRKIPGINFRIMEPKELILEFKS